jgi:hypothetical protein
MVSAILSVQPVSHHTVGGEGIGMNKDRFIPNNGTKTMEIHHPSFLSPLLDSEIGSRSRAGLKGFVAVFTDDT